MHIYDQNLQELQTKVNLKKQLDLKLADLQKQRETFESKVAALRGTFLTEQEDVKKLENKSFVFYLYLVVGQLDNKLDKERKEAYAAQAKLLMAERELAQIDSDIATIRERLNALDGIEKVYASELSKKRCELKDSGSETGLQILQLQKQIGQLKSRKRQIEEAKTAGISALETVDLVLEELRSAKTYNRWDFFNNGGLTGLVLHVEKHGHLDDAQDSVFVLQSKLRRFKTELADVQIKADIKAKTGSFMRYADYFFDGFIVDCAVADHIYDSENATWEVRAQINKLMNKLETMGKATDMQLVSLTEKEEKLIVQA